MATPPAAKAPTKQVIQEYLALDRRRRELNREADSLEKQQKKLGAGLMEFVRENGGDERAVVRSGYRLAIVEAAGRVSWADAFVEVAGQEEADRRRETCPKVERLAIDVS